MIWYQFTPSDTLFFRGAEPMVGGMDYDTRLAFPPSPSVIAGAMRTAVLTQQGIPVDTYRSGHAVAEKIGDYGQPAPFTLLGPVLRQAGEDFVPAPATWYIDGDARALRPHVIQAAPLNLDAARRLGLQTGVALPVWTTHSGELQSLAGSWIALRALTRKRPRLEIGRTLFMPGRNLAALFTREPRTGNALEFTRRVQESKLYSARHLRLRPGFSLVWGLDQDCGLADQGVLSLGGEQRFGAYCRTTPPAFADEISQDTALYLALAPVRMNAASAAALVAAGEVLYRGGWNLAQQFHKDMVGYYAAGAVFNQNMNSLCIPF